ncbi:PEP-CTERM sorting domain-containing protein [bacterium]|nr:MAG: PEP-CTERM sorting domain-containing protein [bacterium]
MKFRFTLHSVVTSALILVSALSHAGSIFLTGHDPDFHASLGSNAVGAQNINKAGIGFIMDPAFNLYVAGGATKFLFVESNIAVPGGHTVGADGVVASGYSEGVDFEKHDATTLNDELNLLGTKYGGIVVASDFGGILTQDELDILNARKVSIITFLNAGGGLYAMAESNSGTHLTPNGGQFGYLPFVTSGVSLDQNESGFTVTPFGNSLGLTDNAINGNASHNFFTSYGGLSVVDRDASGRVMSVAGRVDVVPEPLSIIALSLGTLALLRRRR